MPSDKAAASSNNDEYYSAEEHELDFLKERRKHLRIKLTTKCNHVDQNLDDWDVPQIEEYIEDLLSLRDKLDYSNANVSKMIWKVDASKDSLAKEMDKCDSYNERLMLCLRALKNKIRVPPRDSSPPRQNDGSNYHSNLKLPQVPLPEYGHEKGESLEKFLSNFEEIINKHQLSPYEKFIYLRKQLKREALTLVDSLDGSQQSYDEAKSLLTKAFSSPLVQQYEAIERMAKLKLNYHDNPYSFVSEYRVVAQQIKSLNIDVNTVLQFFVWTGMNSLLQDQFVTINNTNKPSLDQIDEKLFEAVDRYNVALKRQVDNSSSKINLNSLAANVSFSKPTTNKSYKSRDCLLCQSDKKDASHPIFKCKTYPNVKAKIDKIKKLKGCLNCAYLTHQSKDCKFSFNKECRHCSSKFHFSFLCDHGDEKFKSGTSETVPINNTPPVNNMTVVIGFNTYSNYSTDTVLPTFSCLLPSGNQLRGLKDSGCQTNFILSDLAIKEDLNIVKKDLSITINGVNSIKNYKTVAVEVNLKCGDRDNKIVAICLPKISIAMKLVGISDIAKQFRDKGYILADNQLINGDDIDNISLILGANSFHCIPEKTNIFNHCDSLTPSIYCDSPLGALLMGSLSDYKININSLPLKSVNNVKFVQGVALTASVEEPLVEAENAVTGSVFWDINCNPLCHNLNSFVPDLYESEYHSSKFVNLSSSSCETNNTSVNVFNIVINDEVMNEEELLKITSEVLSESDSSVLDDKCYKLLSYENQFDTEVNSDINKQLVQSALSNIKRDHVGRIIVPLLWNPNTCHALAKNFNLAKQILKSNLNKLSKNTEKLIMVNKVIKEQQELGIIRRIDNLDAFMSQNKDCSFLAHMPIFKPGRETTKCRIVYLANLAQKLDQRFTVSHNQALLPGPNLNKKLSTALTLLRFDRYLIIFDLCKAFLMLKLFPEDSIKLCMLWYESVEQGDFSIVGYIHERLPFGLPCSPSLLMLSLYYLLMLDSSESDRVAGIKRSIYNLSYVDNCAYTTNDVEDLKYTYGILNDIFNPFHFKLQQFNTNCSEVQIMPVDANAEHSSECKLLGILWNGENDTIFPHKFSLNIKANTKREILSSIASNYDLLQIYGPILNRARIFMHDLQLKKDIGWDTKLSPELSRDWSKICNQVNSSIQIPIPRFVGKRSDPYKLIAFTDSSNKIFGCVIFICNLITGKLSFLYARNRIVNQKLENRTIPTLELQGIVLGVENLIDTYQELTDETSVVPVNIVSLQLFTDSLVCLAWLNSYVAKIGKMNKKSVLVMNRLSAIAKMCEICPVKFDFCSGVDNPADNITRPLSYKQLVKSCYHSGPDNVDFTGDQFSDDVQSVIIPNPLLSQDYDSFTNVCSATVNGVKLTPLIDIQKYSSYSKVVNIYHNVYKFCNLLKINLNRRNNKFNKSCLTDEELHKASVSRVFVDDQNLHFEEIHNYFQASPKLLKDIPNLVSQLNLFKDKFGLLRVKCKIKRWRDEGSSYPILLAKGSTLARLMISNTHTRLAHAGCYSVLSEIRKSFWIPHIFSVTKKVLKSCVHCKRMNGQTIKLNQSMYRDFRLHPSNIPFRYMYIDYIGPFSVKVGSEVKKNYLLCITCMWSRSINLIVCDDLTVHSFLRAFQMHCFMYGVPEICYSDQGSQIVAGSNIIKRFINDPDVVSYLESKNVKPLEFFQFSKGCSKLGGMVESCVKIVKRLVYGSIRNLILNRGDFEFLIGQVVHIANRRPIAFKHSLRDDNVFHDVPSPITPEILLKGFELPSLNLIPWLQDNSSDPLWDPYSEPVDIVRSGYDKLVKARENLSNVYNHEFVSNLIDQSTNMKERFKPVQHTLLKPGDLVIIKEPLTKRSNFPMGLVTEVVINDLNEVTDVTLIKSDSREKVQRHVSTLIPLLTENVETVIDNETERSVEVSDVPLRKSRKAAEISREKTKVLAADGSI